MARHTVDPAHRMPFLAGRLWAWKHAYYYGKPLVSDAVYDYAERELRALEAAHPDLITYDSPLPVVGAPMAPGCPPPC